MLATPRYSTSALDRETTVYRLADQETSVSLKNTQYPKVDRRVSDSSCFSMFSLFILSPFALHLV